MAKLLTRPAFANAKFSRFVFRVQITCFGEREIFASRRQAGERHFDRSFLVPGPRGGRFGTRNNFAFIFLASLARASKFNFVAMLCAPGGALVYWGTGVRISFPFLISEFQT